MSNSSALSKTERNSAPRGEEKGRKLRETRSSLER